MSRCIAATRHLVNSTLFIHPLLSFIYPTYSCKFPETAPTPPPPRRPILTAAVVQGVREAEETWRQPLAAAPEAAGGQAVAPQEGRGRHSGGAGHGTASSAGGWDAGSLGDPIAGGLEYERERCSGGSRPVCQRRCVRASRSGVDCMCSPPPPPPPLPNQSSLPTRRTDLNLTLAMYVRPCCCSVDRGGEGGGGSMFVLLSGGKVYPLISGGGSVAERTCHLQGSTSYGIRFSHNYSGRRRPRMSLRRRILPLF
jgi:hypothetical protein